MAEQTAQEPTMEEILASIRRIISEDDQPAAAKAAPETGAADDVLELTNRVEAQVDDDLDFDPVPAEPEPVETSGDLEIFSPPPAAKPAPKPAPAPRPAPTLAKTATEDVDALVSAPAAASVSSAFGQLSLSRHTPMPEVGRGLEDVVRELLRPLLADWLDQHLPGIVEARVRAEVERLSRGV